MMTQNKPVFNYEIYKKFLFCSVLFLTMLSSCTKETTTVEQFNFEQKDFIVTDADEATTLVQTFIATLPNNTVGLRDTYDDTDINEGRWILEASGNYEKNANFEASTTSEIRTYDLSVNNVSSNGEILMSGTDMTAKFANMLVTAEAGIVGNERVAGFDVKIDVVSAEETKFKVNTFFVDPPNPYNCVGAPNISPNPTVETNLSAVTNWTFACLNDYIFAENKNTIAILQDCQTNLWIPDLYTVSVSGELPFADLVIDEGGRKCSSVGDCFPHRPENNIGISLAVTVKEYVEIHTNTGYDIVMDIANEIAPPTGQANSLPLFPWRVNLLRTLRPNEANGGLTNEWYMEIRDVVFAKHLIACD